MSKNAEYAALVASGVLHSYADGEVPHDTKFNEVLTAIRALAPDVGTQIDTLVALLAVQAGLFNADHDPTTGKNPVPSEWVDEPATATFVDASHFRLAGDRRVDYQPGQRVLVTLASSTVRVAIVSATFASSTTTVLVTPAALTSPITKVSRGLVRTSLPRSFNADLMPGASFRQGPTEFAIPAQGTPITGLRSILSASIPITWGGGAIGVKLAWGAAVKFVDADPVTTFEWQIRQRLNGGSFTTIKTIQVGLSETVVQNGQTLFMPLPLLEFLDVPPGGTTTVEYDVQVRMISTNLKRSVAVSGGYGWWWEHA